MFLAIILGSFTASHAAPGDLDPTFNPPSITKGGFQAFIYAVAVQADGKVLIGGEFDSIGGVARPMVARFNQDGTVDAAFNTPLQKGDPSFGDVYDVVVQPDGKILVAGSFLVAGQVKYLVRINADGSLDSGFNVNFGGFTDNIYKVVLQPDGKIIIGSNGLDSVDGVPVNYLARLNPDGSLDTPLGAISGATGTFVFDIALQPDGKIVVGGSFYVTRLNSDGTVDQSFSLPDLGSATVYSLSLQADGKILIGGTFSTVNSAAHNLLARLNADGTIDAAFSPVLQFSGVVWKILAQSDGKILFGGSFVRVNGVVRGSIARVNPDSTLDPFHPNPFGVNSNVEDIAIQTDGKVLIVGNFTWVGDQNTPRPGFARLMDAGQGNTGTGTNVTVQSAAGDSSVTFAQVTSPGNTTFTPIAPSSAGAPPTGFTLCPTCAAYDIKTAATIVPPITVCLDVPAAIDNATFSSMVLLHGENGVLVDITTNRVTNTDGSREVCGQASSLSPFVLATQDAPSPSSPAAPSNLTASAVSSTTINLSWSDNSNNETDFELERCDGKGKCRTFMLVASPGENTSSYMDTGLQPGSPYSYRIRAVNSGLYSAYSNTAKDRTPRK